MLEYMFKKDTVRLFKLFNAINNIKCKYYRLQSKSTYYVYSFYLYYMDVTLTLQLPTRNHRSTTRVVNLMLDKYYLSKNGYVKHLYCY